MANAAEIKVMSSQAIKEAYLAFAPEFERVERAQAQHHLERHRRHPQEAARRRSLRHGDPGDARDGGDDQGRQDRRAAAASIWCAPASRIAVPQGAPKPDLSSADAVKRALLAAKKASAIRPGPSGVFLQGAVQALGHLATRSSRSSRRRPARRSARCSRSGDVDIGFQQVSELMLYPGIQYVGPVPKEMQDTSACSTAACTPARSSRTRRATLIKFIASPAALPYIKKTGMEQGAP